MIDWEQNTNVDKKGIPLDMQLAKEYEDSKAREYEEAKRAKVIRMVLEKSSPGTDMTYIVKSASILYDYIHNNLISDKPTKQQLPF